MFTLFWSYFSSRVAISAFCGTPATAFPRSFNWATSAARSSLLARPIFVRSVAKIFQDCHTCQKENFFASTMPITSEKFKQSLCKTRIFWLLRSFPSLTEAASCKFACPDKKISALCSTVKTAQTFFVKMPCSKNIAFILKAAYYRLNLLLLLLDQVSWMTALLFWDLNALLLLHVYSRTIPAALKITWPAYSIKVRQFVLFCSVELVLFFDTFSYSIILQMT